jgi:hypothetical protein
MNMMNRVRSPTRITLSTESLIDVTITYKDIPVLSTAVIDLSSSDHLAQIVKINIGKRNRRTQRLKEDSLHTIVLKNLNIYCLSYYGMIYMIA